MGCHDGKLLSVYITKELLEFVQLSDRAKSSVEPLSGGMKRRITIARSLINEPELLLLDEPTGALDSKTSGELLDYLRRAVDTLGQTIVMVTHDAVAASYTDTAVYVQDGQLVGQASNPTVDDVLAKIKELS